MASSPSGVRYQFPDFLIKNPALLQSIEKKRIDLVMQAGGGSLTGEMGNLGGVQINKGIDDAFGLPGIKARIGIIKGTLHDRGVEVPAAG